MGAILKRLPLAVGLLGLLLIGWSTWPQPRTTFTTDFSSAEITLAVPRSLRAGDAAPARLSLRKPPEAHADAAPLRLVAVLAFDDLAVKPPGEVTLTFTPARPVIFTWRLQSSTPGAYTGSLWLYQILPDGSRLARVTFPLHVRVHTLLGLSGAEARLLGAATLLLAAMLQAVALWKNTSITDMTKAQRQ